MKKIEICKNCGVDYVPKRRGAQKFCSNSCRSRNWFLKQKQIKIPVISDNLNNQFHDVKNPIKKEKMSIAGIGNAAAGVAAVDILKNVFTSKDNKPATKRDINELKIMMSGSRYLPVSNAQHDAHGRKPYYDVETGNVVYL